MSRSSETKRGEGRALRMLVATICMPVALLAVETAWAARPARGERIEEQEVAADEARGGLRYTIMVAKFENESTWHGYDITTAWSELLSTMLAKSGRFTVVAEKDMRVEAMIEQDFAGSGRVQEGSRNAPATGHLTPAQLLVKGTVVEIVDGTLGGDGSLRVGDIPVRIGRDEAAVGMTIQVIDSQTGSVVAAERVVGKAHKHNLGLSNLPLGGALNLRQKDMVSNACADAMEEAVEVVCSALGDVRWQGSVVAASSPEKVIVNRGEREGVPLGQVFEVGTSAALTDPDTGEYLDFEFTPVARLEVFKVSEKVCYCRRLHGSGSIERGMTVIVPDGTM